MFYVIQHIEHKTFYCFDKKDKYKHFSVHIEKAYRFNTEGAADRIRKKLKYPDRWQIRGVRDAKRNTK